MENNFYIRLKYLAQISNKSFNQIEREMNYPRNALNNYKEGREPSASRLVELAHYFRVTPEFMLGSGHDSNQTIITSIFKSFNNEEKNEMYQICYEWLSTSKENS